MQTNLEVKTAIDIQAKSEGTVAQIRRKVSVRGRTPIMFDRYAGDNQTALEPAQKLYYMEDLKTVCLPNTNISSFLSAENTVSAPRRLMGKKWKETAQACLSFVEIQPFLIPLTRNGQPITFGQFQGDVDPVSGIRIHRCVARLAKGVPNPKVRPVLALPWELTFTVTLYPTKELREETLRWLFKEGGRAIGFGTFRGVFGKFEVVGWEALE